jgi:periplasmic divalent cation tolerance protein
VTDTVLIVSTACPDAEVADRIATAVVEQGLAACVHRLAPVVSIYRWRGAVEHAQEVPLLIKTTRERYGELEQALRLLHPYELPEIVAWPIVAGLPAYLRWVAESTAPPMLA